MGYEIGDTFETRHGKMTVVDSLRIQGKNGVLRKYYMLRCEKGHQYPVGESYLKAVSYTHLHGIDFLLKYGGSS